MMSARKFSTEILLKAQPVKIIFLDVDGVLTDGGLYFTEEGETLKRFNTLDGHGLKLLQKAGIVPAIITGRDAKPLRTRLNALGITYARYGVENKRAAAEEILNAMNINWTQAAAMGDDWPDLSVMACSALSCAPINSHPEVRDAADYITTSAGGFGAVREVCDLLLMATGNYVPFLRGSNQ